MDELDISEVAEAVDDPVKCAALLEKVKEHILKFGDEDGDKFEVVKIKDLVAAMLFVNRSPHIEKMGLGIRDVRPLPVREDDVVIFSYPKTGNHWTCNLLRFMVMEGPLEEQVSYQPFLIDLFPPQAVETLASPRVFSAHHKPSLVPRDVFQGKGRVILLYRNPKDTAVSHYYHLTRMPVAERPFQISWSAFIDGWMKGLMYPGDYFEFYNAWQKVIEERKDIKILVVCYEDLKREPLREVKRMSEYLGLSNSDERLQQIVDKCSISNLRADVETGKLKTALLDSDGKSAVYRKGIIGDWRNHFTVAQNEIMDGIISERFHDTMFKQ